VPFIRKGSRRDMLKKFSLFSVLLLCIQLLTPFANAFAFEISAPTNLTANQYYPGNITLKWDKVTGATAYRVYKLDGEQRELVQQVSYQYTETTIYNAPEGISTFAVTAVRNASESVLSNSVTVEVIYPEMQSPAKVSSSIINGNDLILSWDKVTYATDYNIYRVTGDVRTRVATTKSISYTFENHPEGTYVYEITAYNSRFGESATGTRIEVNVVFPEVQIPVVTYSIQNGNDVVFSWQRITYASNYRVYEIIDEKRQLLTMTRLTSHLISNVSAGRHVYEVTAYSDRFGESKAFRIVLDMVYPEMQAPKSLTHTLSNVNDINLRWSQVEYADSYRLYQYVNGEKKLVLSTSALNTTFKNMPEGHYKYEIASYSSRFGESASVTSLEFDLVHPVMKAPENLRISVANGNDLVLRWDEVEHATGYKVYQIINGERKLVATKFGNAHTFVNMPEGLYMFEVTSYSDRFGESKTGSLIEYNLKHPELYAPVLTGKVEEPNTIILDWTKTDNSTGYNIYEVLKDGKKKLVATTTSIQFKFLNKPEGQYIFEVTSYNTRFGESEFSNQVKLYIGPKLEAPKTSEPRVEDDSVTISWGPVKNADSYNVYEVVNGELKLIENTKETSLTINNLEPGDYEYRIVPVSQSGVESESYSTVKVQIEQLDTAPPVTVSNIAELCSKEDIIVHLTATDNQSGVAHTFYSLNGSEFQEGNSFTISEEGRYEISFYSVDKAGNIEEPATVEVYLDKTAPITVLPMEAEWLNKETTLQLVSSDNLCGVETTHYSVNGSEFQEGTDVAINEEGIHEVSFYSVDKAGNVEQVKTVEVKVDKTAPVTTSNIKDSWYTEEVVVQLTATDNLSGVNKTYYSINGSEYVEGTIFEVTEEGITKVSYYSVDKAGNIEEVETIEIKIDKTAPVTTSNVTDSWYKEDVTVQLTAADNLSGVDKTYYSINGSEYKEGTGFKVTEEGITKVSYYSVDKAGNAEEPKTIEVKIDKTAPIVSWDLASEYALGAELPKYTASDTISGVASATVTLNGQKFSGAIKLEKPGTYTLVLTVTDYAGWTTTIEKTFAVYIPATIKINPGVIKENKGTLTVQVTLPAGFDPKGFDIETATLDGVYANKGTNGLVNQSKQGQFKFDREDFVWIDGIRTMEFRAMLNGYLVIGYDTVQVKTKK